jgi:hypothetical protein
MSLRANESLEANCRGLRPLGASLKFGHSVYAQGSVSAAVAQANS